MPTTQRTKETLAQSLCELMEKSPLEEISVGAITENCGISRNTFYYHFQDKYALVNWIFLDSIQAIIAPYPDASRWEQDLDQLLDYLHENRVFYKNALSYSGQNCLEDFMYEWLRQFTLQRIRSVNSPGYAQMSQDEAEFTSDFMAAIVMGLIRRWSKVEPEPELRGYHECVRRMATGEILESYLRAAEQKNSTE